MLDKVEIARRICPVIFMLDTSGSMLGAPIGALNAAMESILPELISMNEENPDTRIEIAVLTFDSGINWATGKTLVDPEGYAWNDLNPGGLTSMGAAFRELNNVLSVNHGFMNRASGSVAPVLFLLSDGEPTDDYQTGLQKLQENNWYKVAARVAVGYGESCNDEVLKEFTKTSETVLHTNDPLALKNLIKFVTITSSMVASRGSVVPEEGGETNSNDTTKLVANALITAPSGLTTDPDDDEF